MSIKIKISYILESEKQLILKLLKPLMDEGYRYKIKQGEPRSLIYIEKRETKKG